MQKRTNVPLIWLTGEQVEFRANISFWQEYSKEDLVKRVTYLEHQLDLIKYRTLNAILPDEANRLVAELDAAFRKEDEEKN